MTKELKDKDRDTLYGKEIDDTPVDKVITDKLYGNESFDCLFGSDDLETIYNYSNPADDLILGKSGEVPS